MFMPEALFHQQEHYKTPYERLALAVVQQAVEDYRELRILRRMYPENRYVHQRYEELAEFFTSEWFGALVPYRRITGEGIIRELEAEEL